MLLSTTLFVDAAASGEIHNGLSWSNAYLDLQAALAVAQAGDRIHVANGLYKPATGTDRAATFALKIGVGLYGGYAGDGAAQPDARDVEANSTVLSGDIGTTDFSSDNSYHVVTSHGVDATAVLDGFTITDGMASGSGSSQQHGGGLYDDHTNPGSPTVGNCCFSGNTAAQSGGAVYTAGGATLINCIFRGNLATSGGALYKFGISSGSTTLIDCTFDENEVRPLSTASQASGGAISTAASTILIRCVFKANTANGGAQKPAYGGAIWNSSSAINLTDCTFVQNSASSALTGYGGGIYNSASNATISACTFIANSASTFGGGIYNASGSTAIMSCNFVGNSALYGGGIASFAFVGTPVTNCLFVRNSARSSGGGLDFTNSTQNGATPQVTNCTLLENSAVTAGGGIYSGTTAPTVSNCILRGNIAATNSQIAPFAATPPTVAFTNIDGGWAGEGNMDIDPTFVRAPSPGADNTWGTNDDDFGDQRLRIHSPCVDSGNNASVPVEVTRDVAGNPRFINVPGMHDPGALVDMGAYEYTLPLIASSGSFQYDSAKPTMTIRFNGDIDPGTVSAADLVLINLTSGQNVDTGANATANYDYATRTASWTFPNLLPDGNYHATILAAAVVDEAGNPLTANALVDFFFLQGDANRDRKVNTLDFNILAGNFGGASKMFSEGNFNYDAPGVIDSLDFNIFVAQYGKTLPAPAPAAVVGLGPVLSPFGSNGIADAAGAAVDLPGDQVDESIAGLIR